MSAKLPNGIQYRKSKHVSPSRRQSISAFKMEKALRKNGFDLCHAVHESEYRVLKTPPTPAHKFEVTLEPDTFTEEKFALFNDYQRNVHKEPPSMISRSGFKGFLCSSPLIRTTRESGSPFGSYHQCYRVDGELVAIGVIDLLPHSVSAVYFIYRDDVSKWNFGKLGALREAALTIEEGLKYYYMGYYIHSCIKMRYKGDYSPQFVLDPETYDWDALDDDLRSRLDVRKYVSLSRERRLGIGAPTEKRAQDNTPETQSAPDADESESSNTTSSLFSTSMPGVLTASQVSTTMDLGKVRIRVRGVEADAEDLVTWTRDAIDSPYSIKGIIAELAATVGPEVLRGIVVEF
ncbi:MAG: Arginyl-tRNA--protein transferase 1 [Piccolia ochrophora]|nr:MAG: Arginyl-tRNA--protein transferase 1 [Piccolia ochrophora]